MCNNRVTQAKMNLLNNFRNYLRKQNVSKTTIRNYVSDVRQYYNFLLDTQGLTTIAVDDNITNYLNPTSLSSYEHYLTNGDLSSSTIRRRLVALTKFVDFVLSPDQEDTPDPVLETGEGYNLLGRGVVPLLLTAFMLTLLIGVAIGINQGRKMLAYELRQEISALGQVAGAQSNSPPRN